MLQAPLMHQPAALAQAVAPPSIPCLAGLPRTARRPTERLLVPTPTLQLVGNRQGWVHARGKQHSLPALWPGKLAQVASASTCVCRDAVSRTVS